MRLLLVWVLFALVGSSAALEHVLSFFKGEPIVTTVRDIVGALTIERGPKTKPNAPNANPEIIEIPNEERNPLKKPSVVAIGLLDRVCECGDVSMETGDIQKISDRWCNGGGASGNVFGLSNMVWAWGQFLDHEVVGTIDDSTGPTFTINLANSRTMPLHRVRTLGDDVCASPLNVHSGAIDGTVVYGADADFEKTLVEPGSCRLKEGEPGFLPLTTKADEEGRFFIVAGDARADEHSVLASMHTLWLREHNRLCDVMEADRVFSQWSPARQYKTAKSIVVAKLQQITLNEFLPALGISIADLRRASRGNSKLGSEVSLEFSMAYRFGHTAIPDKVGDLTVANLFDAQMNLLNNEAGGVGYKNNSNAIIDNIFTQVTGTQAAEMDGKMSDALRNILFGHKMQEDLCARNVFRSREMGMPSYAGIARCFGQTPDAEVESVTPDMFLGLLREPRPAGQPLGPTHKAIFVDQFGRSIFGPKGLWWRTDRTLRAYTALFRAEILHTSMNKVISDNTGATLSGEAFKAGPATIVDPPPEPVEVPAPEPMEVPAPEPVEVVAPPQVTPPAGGQQCDVMMTDVDINWGSASLAGSGGVTNSDEACLARCTATPTCNAMIRIPGGRCFLKAVNATSFDARGRTGYNSQVICGGGEGTPAAAPKCGTLFTGMNVLGTTLPGSGGGSSSDAACLARCRATPTCNAMIRIPGGRCFMKAVDPVGFEVKVGGGLHAQVIC